jgi:hypothetical protein
MIAFYILFGLALYLLPTIIALGRSAKANVMQVAVVNVLLGWTFIGWVAALVLSLSNTGHPQSLVVQQHVTIQGKPEDE